MLNVSKDNFSVLSRYADFWSRIVTLKVDRKNFLIDAIAWFTTFIVYIYPQDALPGINILVVLANLFFLTRLTAYIDKSLRPPTEILMALFFLFAYFDTLTIRACLSNTILQSNFLYDIVHLVLVSMLVLLFSLILFRNSSGKKSVLFVPFLICMPALPILESNRFFLLIVLQIVLFIFLLRKTSWLEELTKTELYISLPILYFVFTGFTNLNIYGFQADPFSTHSLWYAWPRLLHVAFKIYLVCLFLKIPIVLIYNFASLSRKLKISGLFQSTFPQLIQLGVLLLIFYAFIAGWQAEKTRRAIWNTFDDIVSGEIVSSGLVRKFDPMQSGAIQIPGYKPFFLGEQKAEQGIIQLEALPGHKSSEYFLFKEMETSRGKEEIICLNIDSFFLKNCSENIFVLAGTHLVSYPYAPSKIEQYFYELLTKTPLRMGQDKNFYIFPLGVIPHEPEWLLQSTLKEYDNERDWARTIDDEIVREKYIPAGRLITPIFDTSFNEKGFFAFDILLVPNLDLFTSNLGSYVLLLVIVFLLINTLVTKRMVTFGSEINQMIVQKFGHLKEGIREISTGNLDYKVKIDGKDEFVELAGHFNQMGDRLKESIADVREKERLAHELTIAKNVQLDLLPNKLPHIPGFEVAAILETANEVGGDFYDVIQLDKNRFLITVGDVSGKGTSAAFYMAQCISLIRYSPQFTDKPEEIALKINEYFSDSFVDKKIFVTAIFSVLDVREKSITFIRAGHTKPIFVAAGEEAGVREIDNKGIGLGIQKNREQFIKSLEPVELTFEDGDMLVFFTDGIEEAAIGKQETEEKFFYSVERLKKKLGESHNSSAPEIVKAVSSDIKAFYGEENQVDDYTLLVLKKK